MNVVLFYPRGKAWKPGADVGHLAAVLPPLGLASIAAVLREAGHGVTLFDAALHNRVTNEQWADRIARLAPDVVGFSALTPAFHDAYDVCLRVKDLLPDVKTVFGGVHVSWGRELLMAEYPAIDYIVAGEGEPAFRELLAGTAPSEIPGLVHREGETARAARPQARDDLCVMDDLPFPAYDLLEGFPKAYNLPLFGYTRPPGTHIISSRGCVYQCSYCDRSVFRRTFRWNSPEYTFELVKYLRTDFGIRHVQFYDDLFTLNRERVARLCALLKESKLGVRFNCIVRIGHIDPELIELLKDAGCWMVNVGIESGDQELLDTHKDGLSLEDIRRDVGTLHRSGLYVKGLFMLGFPGESIESMRRTIDLAVELPLKDANVTAFTPYPGAPITQGIEQHGAFDTNWDRMDCEQFVFISREAGSRETLESLRSEFIRRFYQRRFAHRLYRKMMWESPHSYWRLVKHLGVFLNYRKAVG